MIWSISVVNVAMMGDGKMQFQGLSDSCEVVQSTQTKGGGLPLSLNVDQPMIALYLDNILRLDSSIGDHPK
ncbi:hypothetical protein AVEN_183608-1 [Araneus ventricosus]|uniref:Uncharacterized protein n=1 Tax=Araneus ventricosus TaxID=182803 RepID=A0A4Y2UN74_ARAVE|nr:hypothetical protein AVEN_183608-1 [Araneus ventricosus]